MSQLRSAIARLAEDFATAVLRTVHAAPLSELATLHGSPGARSTAAPAARRQGDDGRGAAVSPRLRRVRRGGRRSGKDIQTTVDAVVAAVKRSATGLRSEQIQQALGLTNKDIARPLQIAIENKQLKRKGERRATTYFAT